MLYGVAGLIGFVFDFMKFGVQFNPFFGGCVCNQGKCVGCGLQMVCLFGKEAENSFAAAEFTPSYSSPLPDRVGD